MTDTLQCAMCSAEYDRELSNCPRCGEATPPETPWQPERPV